jgi:hypothetical protein
MPLITGSVFLAGALLSCLLPIGLLICFATFFTRQVRRMPPNATPPAKPTEPANQEAATPAGPAADL